MKKLFIITLFTAFVGTTSPNGFRGGDSAIMPGYGLPTYFQCPADKSVFYENADACKKKCGRECEKQIGIVTGPKMTVVIDK